VAACAWLLYVTWGSSPFATCQAGEQQREASKVTHDKAPKVRDPLIVRARRGSWCTGVVWYDERDGVLVIATVLLAIYTYRLWDSTAKLVTGADETAKRELRAYVSVTPANLAASLAPGAIPKLMIGLQNHGQTPAYDVSQQFLWGTYPVSEHDRLPFPISAKQRGYLSTLILDPGAQRNSYPTGVAPTSEADSAMILAGVNATGESVRFYCMGYIFYRDAFGTEHNRQFCYFFGPDSPQAPIFCVLHNAGT
jgi:hypothetical protein